MSLLKSELSLNDKATQLLEAAGLSDVSMLAASDASRLRQRLTEVNRKHKIYKKLPGLSTLEKWIEEARAAAGVTEESSVSASEEIVDDAPEAPELVNFELDPDVLEMIALAPLALPIPGKSLAEKQVPVSEIPEGILLTAARGDVSIRVGTKSPEKAKESQVVKTPVIQGSHVNTISFGLKREEVDRSRIRSIQELADPNKIPDTEDYKAKAEERMRLLRAALPETNEGVDPSSRRYIRGVLHSNPHQIWWGALFTLGCHVMIPLGIFGAFALLLKDNGSSLFQWVPGWFLALPIGVFVVGFLYLIISFSCTCRICGQKCFVPRNCLKNRKAHHIPILGYVFAVALHIVLFRWFRCTYCGTPVRVKE
jgi:hypothetical protein